MLLFREKKVICLCTLLALMLFIMPAAGADTGLLEVPSATDDTIIQSETMEYTDTADVTVLAAATLYDDAIALIEGNFTCTASSGTGYEVSNLTPLGALHAACGEAGLSYVINDKSYAGKGILLLDGVGTYLYDKTAGTTWICSVNGNILDDYGLPTTDGFNVHTLEDGDVVEFFFGVKPVSSENATATIRITIGEPAPGADVLYDDAVALIEGNFTCTASSGTGYEVSNLTPLGALHASCQEAGLTYVINDKSYAGKGILLLDGIGTYLYDKTAGTTWICSVNGNILDDYGLPATDGFNVHTLEDGDIVEFLFGVKPVSSETATAKITITVGAGEPPMPPAGAWTLDLKGKLTETVDRTYFEQGIDCGHDATYTDDDGNVWSGMPLWYLVGLVDDSKRHGVGAFNDSLAAQGYSVKVVAGDGYSINIPSASMAENDGFIVADTLNGQPLPATIGEKNKPCWPLQLIGPSVSSGQKVGNIVEIELVGLPEPSTGWTITLSGAFNRTLSQAEFEEGVACGHAAGYTDSQNRVWTGIPLWYLAGIVDDIQEGSHWGFNDTRAANEYTIEIVAQDGYTVTLNSADIARNDTYIVSNKMNAAPLTADTGYPLKLQGSGLTGGSQRVGTIASINLIGLPDQPAPGEWTLTMIGPKITAVISQSAFEEAAACHGTTYNDGVSTWSGLPLWYLAGWVDDDVMHGSGAFNDNLAGAGYTVIVSSGGASPYSKEFTSQEIVANKNQYIVANSLNGSAITDNAFPIRLVGEGAPGSKSVGNVETIELTEFQEPTTLPSVHIVRYAADGVTILNETTKTYQWMEQNLFIYGGESGVRLRFQGPTFNPNDLWNPAEDINPGKVDEVVKATSIRDLCDLVGGAPEGSEIILKASDGYEAKLNYTNLYTPLDRQGEPLLAWWTERQGYVPDYTEGIRLFFNSPDGIFGADDMRACLAQNYWHYYGDSGIQYPSAAGVSNKNIVTVEIHPGAREDWTLLLSGAISDTIPRSYFEAGKACALGGHGATYTDGNGDVWSGMPLWLLVGWVDDDNKHNYGSNPFREDLADAGYNVTVIDYGPDGVKGTDDDFSATFNSTVVKYNNNIIVANEIDGIPLPNSGDKPSWPLKMVGSALTSNKQKVGSIDEIALDIKPVVTGDAEIELNTGWNFISIPKRLSAGNNTAEIFSNVQVENRSIWDYNAALKTWVAMKPTDTLGPLKGYWIYSAEEMEIPLFFNEDPLQTPPTRELYKGWNAIGFTDLEPAQARDTLLSLGDAWTQAIGFNAGNQLYETSIIRGGTGSHSDAQNMMPEKGYWIYMRTGGELAAIGS